MSLLVPFRRLACASALALVCAAPALAQADSETTRIADGVYQFRWQAHNGLIVVTDDGVFAFDPISLPAAEAMAAEIQRLAPGAPLLGIVYSHHHADHVTGAGALRSAFGADVPIFAHENALPALEAAADPNIPLPTVTFARELSMGHGDRTVELHFLGRNHSDNSVVARIADVGVIFAVDFISNDRVGFQALPDYYFPDFFRSLARVLELDFETVVFGHGPSGDRSSIHRQIAYYDDLRAAVADAVERGLTEDAAATSVRLPAYAGWGQYEAWFPQNVRAIHRWMSGGGR